MDSAVRTKITQRMCLVEQLPFVALIVFLFLAFANGQTAWAAPSVIDLYDFDSTGPVGGDPLAGLIQATDGNFYGMTSHGASFSGAEFGAVFRMDSSSHVVTPIHAFNGVDGAFPFFSGLIQASDGYLYGVTGNGGPPVGGGVILGYGNIFKMDLAGNITTIYAFSCGDDGGVPRGDLLQATDGNFYGLTPGPCSGGTGGGTIFKVTPNGSFTTLYRFSGGSDGDTPDGLIQGRDGNFYGVTLSGGSGSGAYGYGTIFKLTPSGTLTTLYTFTGGDDGSAPRKLVEGSDGNFYSTTGAGGVSNCGVVFKITPTGVFTTLYKFTCGSDGGAPYAQLLEVSPGLFYGAAGGTIFKITSSGTLTTLHSTSGATRGQLVAARDGNYYGVSAAGTHFNGQLYMFGPNTLTISLLDPVPMLVNGSGVLTNPASLAAGTSIVEGVAADGTTQIVVRIAAPSAGIPLQLWVEDEEGQPAAPGGGPTLGYLTTLLPADGSGSTEGGTPIVVTTVALPDGTAAAFAVYHVPNDFVRADEPGDPGLSQRIVSLHAQSGVSSVKKQVKVVRPPVAFIHGIWGDTVDGIEIEDALQSRDLGIVVSEASYSGDVTVISSSPSYGSNLVVAGSSLGFKFGAMTALARLDKAIDDYRTLNPLSARIAVSAADIVAHSMGGDVVRTMPLIKGFSSSRNFNQGPIHKLITIGTPHLGSPLALQLMQSASACTRKILAKKGRYALTSASTSLGSFPGGTGDLRADLAGSSASMSAALKVIQPDTTTSPVRIPTGLIAGVMTPAQLATVDNDWHARIIRVVCHSDPLASALTSSGWPTIVGQQSDAIVPLSSQLAGTGTTLFPYAPAVHSPGAEALGFASGNPPGPSELDASSGIPDEVLQLLNTPVSDPVFLGLP